MDKVTNSPGCFENGCKNGFAKFGDTCLEIPICKFDYQHVEIDLEKKEANCKGGVELEYRNPLISAPKRHSY